MGDQASFPPSKLLVGVILGPRAAWDEVATALAGALGPLDHVGPELDFSYTDYYYSEMGRPQRRRFATVAGLWDPERLAEAKIVTNGLEVGAAEPGARTRRFNLDPGLLSLHSLILATTKPHAHRVPLHSGIYAEVTLVFRDGAYQPLPWTYPDYAGDEYQQILLNLRQDLKKELATLKHQENRPGT